MKHFYAKGRAISYYEVFKQSLNTLTGTVFSYLVMSLKPRTGLYFSLDEKVHKNRPTGAHPKDKSRLGRYFAKIADISLNISESFHSVSFRRSFLNGFYHNFLTRYRPRSLKNGEEGNSNLRTETLGSITNYLQIYFRAKLVIYFILLLATILCFNMFTHAQELPGNQGAATGHVQQPRTVLRGEVRSAVDGRPIDGASIKVKGGKESTITDGKGAFSLTTSLSTGKLTVSHLGFLGKEIQYDAQASELHIALVPSDNMLEEVDVVSTGYQKIPKERSTGSFEFVDNKLLNRKVSLDFISRLEDVVPSISTVKVYDENRGVLPNFNIRGISSIRSSFWPLIVVDGFPYHGNFNNINPNDIENITILKDAAASSIWGAQSGNGVVVITTKKSKMGKGFRLSFNGNTTVEAKPDLYSFPQIGTSDYIDIELLLFEKGYYNSRMYSEEYGMTPVVELLKEHKEGHITDDELRSRIDALRGIDMRDDFSKYIYRRAVKQQYNVQLSGGTDKVSNIFSLGYDKQLKDIVTSSAQRINVRSQTTFKPISRLELNLGTHFSNYSTQESLYPVRYNEMGRGYGNYPYMKLADAAGNPLAIESTGLNRDFKDTVAQGRLLDWEHRPLAELNESSVKIDDREAMLSTGIKYGILPGLDASLLYNFRTVSNKRDDWKGIGSVMQRVMINYWASWDDNSVKWNYPLGDYLVTSDKKEDAHQGRFQLDYNRVLWDKHEINALAGAEIRQLRQKTHVSEYFGYDPETHSFQFADLLTDLPYLDGRRGVKRIISVAQISETVNRFTSYFANVGYTYDSRYIVNASARKDASNLFGVRTNDKGQPFWSVGGAWVASQEGFLTEGPFALLKLRATYGKNGNVNNTTSAYPTMMRASQPNFLSGLPYASIQNPPNPNLRWESVGMLNLGLDFATKDARLRGSVEYYLKTPKDLIMEAQIDPTMGFQVLSINSADLKAQGVDISLSSKNVSHKDFEWNTDLVFAYNRTRVTRSYIENPIGRNYRTGAYSALLGAIEGEDPYAIVTYKWGGLDPQTGRPRGYVNGELSTDYSAIVNRTQLKDMDFLGSTRPLYFGSFRNSFRYRKWDISVNISYQLGHKFVRKSIDYTSLLGHSDYALRWQKPGDELVTDVPAFTYPANSYADEFYKYSSALVTPAGQIKWRDIQLGCNLDNSFLKDLRLYAYAANIMTIWRANKLGRDSEFGNNPPDPFALSIGLNFNL